MIFSDLPTPAEASVHTIGPYQGFAQAGNRCPLFGIMRYSAAASCGARLRGQTEADGGAPPPPAARRAAVGREGGGGGGGPPPPAAPYPPTPARARLGGRGGAGGTPRHL